MIKGEGMGYSKLKIIKEVLNAGKLNEEDWYSVRNVSYNNNGSISCYEDCPVDICGGSIEEIGEFLNDCSAALNEEVLEDGKVEFTNEHEFTVHSPISFNDFANWSAEQTSELTKSVIEKQKRIKVNKAQCLSCFGIIESKYRHDFVTCSCGGLSVDGGKDYLKRSGEFNSFAELSEYEEE